MHLKIPDLLIQWHVQLVHLPVSKRRTSILLPPHSSLQELRGKKGLVIYGT